MRHFLTCALSLAVLCSPLVAFAEKPSQSAPAATPAPAEKCEHGVKSKVCARCNPKLAAAFKAKNDWCAEHERPESQCVLCNPKLARDGVKP